MASKYDQGMRRRGWPADMDWHDMFGGAWGPTDYMMRGTSPERFLRAGEYAGSEFRPMHWAPAIDTFQRGDQFIIRADLPGMKKEDVHVHLNDDSVTIEGERRDEHEAEHHGFYRSERVYGSFYRVVPFPEGAIPETAKASFKHGVLEISVQAPPHDMAGKRQLEISEG